METLFQDIQYIKGIGPRRSRLLHRMGVHSVFDLLWFVPRAYVNRNHVTLIADLKLEETCQLQGRVQYTSRIKTRRKGFSLFKALIEDSSGMAEAIWFNQPYLDKAITVGQKVWIRGKVKAGANGAEVQVGEYEILEDGERSSAILPVYPLTEGLNQKILRTAMSSVLAAHMPYYPELLNEELRKEYGLCDIHEAFRCIHFPETGDQYLLARRRLVVEELILFRWMLKKNLSQRQEQLFFTRHGAEGQLIHRIIKELPFELTAAQRRVMAEIIVDMKSERSMNRLLQGDVGSGKTVIAALAMAHAIDSGYQAALMAPTEILAEQHYQTISRLLDKFGLVTARLTGGSSAAERRLVLEAAAQGEIDVLIGTHALIQEEVTFKKLGLVVIDEQHRFGVRQRALLAGKGMMPDILVMTATPIPRTLALTLYGDLDLSVIDEMPPGRKATKTKMIPFSQRLKAYNFARREIESGARAYVICPLVEESEKQDLQAAVTLYDELSHSLYPDLKVGLVHGRMPAGEKEAVMQAFKKGDLQVLVSTTVIEVGVDVPEASVIIIEHADRFGLSQLHQLRGRVGRGERQSYCILLADPHTEEAVQRLEAMERTNDGFELANQDLAIRGPGEFWGLRQHGMLQFHVVDLLRDQSLISKTDEITAAWEAQDLPEKTINLLIKNKYKNLQDIAPN